MKKFKFLVKYGLLKRVKGKAFIISNVIVFILLTVIINIPSIISAFDNGETMDHMSISIYNYSGDESLAIDLSDRLNEGLDTDFYSVSEIDEAFEEEAFWSSDTDVSLVFDSMTQIGIYSKLPEYNQLLSSQIELLLIDYQLPGYVSPSFTNNFAPDYEDPEQDAMIGSMSSLLILPMFILITMATQFVGVDIIEEKSSKAIETIIASVPAKTHFLSKITAAITFVIIQGLLIVLYGTIATLLFSNTGTTGEFGDTANLLSYIAEFLPNWQLLLVFTLLFMVVGTLFYLIFSAMFASMAVTQEDYQQFQTPIMLTLLIGFYIAIFSGMAGGDMILKIASFIPLFTPVVAPVAFASGALSVLEALIALVVMVIFLIGSLYLVSPVYRVAILNYDQTKFGKRVKGYFKKAFHKNKA